jgi:hypothetical protein
VSYLTPYAVCRPVFGWLIGGKGRPDVRVDERLLLNLPGFHGGAFVRVYVEDTSQRTEWRGAPPEPRIRLRIADCTDEIELWFELDSAQARTNSLHKIETLLGSLHRFRDALVAEADLSASRSSRKEDHPCRT